MKQVDISTISHTTRSNSIGQEVTVLNNGAIITAEDAAMLQALHSRDPKGIKSHLEKLAKSGSGKLMQTFYVGYGHKSIGDCGFTTLFIENISMLAAKAIQDSPLYNGQECSTRYIDFSRVPFYDGVNNNLESNPATQKLREFYINSLPEVIEDLKKRYPIGLDDQPNIYEKAIKARAFDILRGFLPAGALTNVAWTTNLRQLADRLGFLRHHPLEEVKSIAQLIEDAVRVAHPNSFGHKKYDTTETFNAEFSQNYYYQNQVENNSKTSSLIIFNQGINKQMLQTMYGDLLEKRARGSEMPKQVAVCGSDSFFLHIDFGSYRDLQRHRAINQTMPLLTTKLGFEKWYLQNLPNDLQIEAKSLLSELEEFAAAIPNLNQVQYYLPMGYKVGYYISGDLPALTYLSEIRSGSTVHPTARNIAFQLGEYLKDNYKIPIYCDADDIGRFDVKRGNQDIVQK